MQSTLHPDPGPVPPGGTELTVTTEPGAAEHVILSITPPPEGDHTYAAYGGDISASLTAGGELNLAETWPIDVTGDPLDLYGDDVNFATTITVMEVTYYEDEQAQPHYIVHKWGVVTDVVYGS